MDTTEPIPEHYADLAEYHMAQLQSALAKCRRNQQLMIAKQRELIKALQDERDSLDRQLTFRARLIASTRKKLHECHAQQKKS